jgi:hypothetical protein
MEKYINKWKLKKDIKQNKELIDTKNKCIDFLKENEIDKNINIENWIKYSLGNILFKEIKKQYYYIKKEILNVYIKNDIYNYNDHKKFYMIICYYLLII